MSSFSGGRSAEDKSEAELPQREFDRSPVAGEYVGSMQGDSGGELDQGSFSLAQALTDGHCCIPVEPRQVAVGVDGDATVKMTKHITSRQKPDGGLGGEVTFCGSE